MHERTVQFSLRRGTAGGFRAEGVDVPIVAEASHLRDLRARLKVAIRRRFGRDRGVTFLVGAAFNVVAAEIAGADSALDSAG
jgi:hypothetical protein